MTGGGSRLPRLLTIMGSGETAPTMVKVHRSVVERLGTDAGPGILIDTPFGFQMNASEISARAVAYFRDSVGAALEVAGLRSAEDLRGPGGDTIISRLARAPFVFSGPGSPTYALRQWRATLVPGVLAEKLALGGALTFASAAALTLGVTTVPVYEIYKVGAEPRWVEGLDLLRAVGLPVAVIPHYDNAEGGTHDTRYCYLGEPRLALLEQSLPEGTFVLGVDEHTALVIDLDDDLATVTGRGGVTVRSLGRSARIEAGESLSVGELRDIAERLRREVTTGAASRSATTEEPSGSGSAPGMVESANRVRGAAQLGAAQLGAARLGAGGSPLLEAVRAHEEAFRAARLAHDPAAMVSAILALEDELWAWRADTLQSDEFDRGRASLRAMVGELGRLAESGTGDQSDVIGPYVDLALALRDAARRERRYADADEVRDGLVRLGITVHDTPEGSTWELGDDGPGRAPEGS